MVYLIYLSQVIIYTALLCLIYVLFLHNRAVHAFNRMFLLAAAIVPLLLPLIKIPGLEAGNTIAELTNIRLPEIYVDETATGPVADVFTISAIVYACISAALLLLMVVRIGQLRRVISKSPRTTEAGYTIVQHTGYGPGSWGNHILLPDGEAPDAVICHEAAHVRLRHSADVIALQLIQVLCWPNILLIWIRRELAQVHEFQADAAVDISNEQYAQLLLSSVFDQCQLPLTHSFIFHPLKRRIMMLKKNEKNYANIFVRGLSMVALTTLCVGIVAVQSCTAKKWEVRQDTPGAEAPKTQAKVQPQFNGDLAAFLGSNLQYPKEAQAKKIEGRVMVRFIVDQEGNVTNPEILKSPDPLLSAEAIRVLKQMPRWIPGKDANGNPISAEFILPVSFKL